MCNPGLSLRPERKMLTIKVKHGIDIRVYADDTVLYINALQAILQPHLIQLKLC